MTVWAEIKVLHVARTRRRRGSNACDDDDDDLDIMISESGAFQPQAANV